MSMSWTTATAIWGAVTGSYGAVVATLGRRDVKWRRAAKQLPEVRTAIEALRNAVAEAQLGNRTLGSLRETGLRANLDLIQEVRIRLSHRALARSLIEVDHSYSALLALGDNARDQQKVEALAHASTTLDQTVDRLAFIERKAAP